MTGCGADSTARDQIRVEHLVRRLQRHRHHPEERRDRHEGEDDAREIERKPNRLQHRPLCRGQIEELRRHFLRVVLATQIVQIRR